MFAKRSVSRSYVRVLYAVRQSRHCAYVRVKGVRLECNYRLQSFVIRTPEFPARIVVTAVDGGGGAASPEEAERNYNGDGGGDDVYFRAHTHNYARDIL